MNFITFNKPLKTDLILVIVYALLTLFLFINTKLNSNFEYNKKIILGYVVLSHLSIYSIFYRGLRNGYLFTTLVFIGILHLIFRDTFQFEPQLQYKLGFAGDSLKYTLVLIALFQTLRYIHLKFFNKELETVMFQGLSLFEERKLVWSDWIICGIYFMTMILLWACD